MHSLQPLLLRAAPLLLLSRQLRFFPQPLLARGLGLGVAPLLLALAPHLIVIVGLRWIVLVPA